MGIKYKVNETFFKKWSPEMAYVLGFVCADGSIYKSSRGSYLSITSVDKPIIQLLKRLLKSEHTIRMDDKLIWEHSRPRFLLRIGNKSLYEDLILLGVTPSKSLTMDMPNIPSKYLRDFVRGYFDGDGCVYLATAKGKTRLVIIKQLSVIFTSGSKKFLESLSKVLDENLNLVQKKVYNSHRSFQVRYRTKDSLKLFEFLYKGCDGNYLKRKFDIFQKYFKMRKVKGAVAKKLTRRSAKP